MKVTIIGAGFVGLPTSTRFCLDGHKVNLVDINQNTLDTIRSGKAHFHEPGLDEQVRKSIGSDQFGVYHGEQLEEAIQGSRFIYMCVPTPSSEDGSCNTSYLESACNQLAPLVQEGQIVVVKSTVPAGTTTRLYEKMRQSSKEFEMAMNPETMAEGTALRDLEFPSRIIVGRLNEALDPFFKKLYSPVTRSDDDVFFCNSFESAELAKYGSNAALSSRLCLVNEISRVCEETGADSREVFEAMGLDPRIGEKFLHPSKHGYGGSCFDKDIRGLQVLGEKHGLAMYISHANWKSNEYCVEYAVEDLAKHMGGVEGKLIAVWGLSFKKGTSDVRNSQQIEVVKKLLEGGAYINAHDPEAIDAAKELLGENPRLSFHRSKLKVPDGAHALLIQTEWSTYRGFDDWVDLKHMMEGNLVADYKAIYKNPYEITDAGLDYLGVGRPFMEAGSKPKTYHRELPELMSCTF